MNLFDVETCESPAGEPPTTLGEELAEPVGRLLSWMDAHERLSSDGLDGASLEIYRAILGDIAAAAARHDAVGLLGVCRSLADMLLELQQRARPLGAAQVGLLEEFPSRVSAYLEDTRDRSRREELAGLLQDDRWPRPLSGKWVNALIGLLDWPGDSRGHSRAFDNPVAQVEDETPVAVPASGSIGETEAVPPAESGLNGSASAEALMEEIGRVYALAEAAGLPGLQEICGFVLHNTGCFCESGGIEAAPLKMLVQFPALAQAHLNAPTDPETAAALAEYLGEELWPEPLALEEWERLLFLLQVASPGSVRTAESSRGDITPSDEPSPLNPITAGAEERESGGIGPRGSSPPPDLEETAVEPATEDAIDPAALNPVFEELLEINALAEQTGLPGLQEVCQFVERNLGYWLEPGVRIDAVALSLLSRFPALARDHLANPRNPASSVSLCEYLGEAAWPQPLEIEAWERVLQGLQADSGDDSETSAVAAVNAPSSRAQGSSADTELPFPPITAETQVVDEELLALLSNELESMEAELQDHLAEACRLDAADADKVEALANYLQENERLQLAARTVGLTALESLLGALGVCVTSTVSAGEVQNLLEPLSLLPRSILAYLIAPRDPSACEGLVDILRSGAWVRAPGSAYASALARALATVEIRQDSSPAEARQRQGDPEDVSLILPSDLNQELLDGLLQELPVHTGDFSTAIQRIAAGHGTQADMDVAKRAAHTLKGAANTVGVRGIATLTHHVEDILVALTKRGAMPRGALAEVLSNAGDCLETMSEAVMGIGPEPSDALDVLNAVLDWANRIDRDGIPEWDEEVDRGAPAHPPTSEPAETTGSSGPSRQGEVMVRVPASLIDELLRLMGETIISTGQVRERLRRVVAQTKTIQQQNRSFIQLASELEESVDRRGVGAGATSATRGQEFDPLEFEHYSELHTLSRRLIEAANDAGEMSGQVEGELGELNELLEVQSRLHAQSQNAVMRTRMVPVSSVVSRLHRSVRQVARLLDKSVNLDVTGADTMVDSNILNQLVDPLMHMLRNAVDHGIEPPERRIAAGKPPAGSVELAFLREGNNIVVRCRDDGSGLDLDAIRRAGESKGLIAVGSVSSDDEVARLILVPGFSTRAESTQTSGRGIGMDVVHSQVLQLKGGMSLRNSPGRGLEIEMRLPATLLSTHALIVRSRERRFAIASYGIQDIRYVTPEQVQNVAGADFLRLEEELHPLVKFDALLNLPRDRRADDRRSGFPALLVRDDAGKVHAVQVQEIAASSDLVVKNLGRYVPRLHGVVGATILGDGSVAAVLDLPELMRKPVQRSADQPGDSSTLSAPAGATQEGRRRLRALVVDDSLSARRATGQFMKDAGFDVRTAIDGMEAVAILDSWKPDILLVDMEMPRMNGLELTARVRASEQTATLPVIMISSRSTEKHRRQAEASGVSIYLTKPFNDDQLLRHVTGLTAR